MKAQPTNHVLSRFLSCPLGNKNGNLSSAKFLRIGAVAWAGTNHCVKIEEDLEHLDYATIPFCIPSLGPYTFGYKFNHWPSTPNETDYSAYESICSHRDHLTQMFKALVPLVLNFSRSSKVRIAPSTTSRYPWHPRSVKMVQWHHVTPLCPPVGGSSRGAQGQHMYSLTFLSCWTLLVQET